jgi:hypothetical protein
LHFDLIRMQAIKHSDIEKMIFIVRGHKVIIDSDLAALYEVETKYLNRSVRRNLDRFPEDFMFELTAGEYDLIRNSRNIRAKDRGLHKKYPTLVFTEQGVAMLSSVLNSAKAISVNISVMRSFVKIRQILMSESMSDRVSLLEKGTDKLFKVIFQRLDTLESELPTLPNKRRKMGIKSD